MRGRAAEAPPSPFVTPAVYGLDVGREYAHRAQRSRRFRNRVIGFLFGLATVVGFATIAWVGYQAYIDHTRAAELEHERGVEEMNRKYANQTVDDVITDLEETPTFNGPGAPTLGLGPGTTQP